MSKKLDEASLENQVCLTFLFPTAREHNLFSELTGSHTESLLAEFSENGDGEYQYGHPTAHDIVCIELRIEEDMADIALQVFEGYFAKLGMLCKDYEQQGSQKTLTFDAISDLVPQ